MFSDGDDSVPKGTYGNIQRHFWPLQPGKGANDIWSVEDTDITNHPVALRTGPYSRELSGQQNVNSALQNQILAWG